MGVNWTAKQEEAITYRGQNILVSAGAGSGKTTVLIERIIRRLKDAENPVDVDRLLVVTYTNAAAAEMKHRLAVALQKAIAENPGNKHLSRQLSLLQRAQITTLHSFCLDVVRKYYYLLDIDPDTKIGNETDLYMLREAVLDEVFADFYDLDDSPLRLLLRKYSRGIDDRGIKEMVLKTVENANSLPDPRQWLEGLRRTYDDADVAAWMSYLVENCRHELEYYLKQYDEIIALCSEEINGLQGYCAKLLPERAALDRAAAALGAFQNPDDWDACVEAVQQINFQRLSGAKKDCDPDVKEFVTDFTRDIIKKAINTHFQKKYFSQSYQEIMEDMAALRPVADGLVEICLAYMNKWQERKKEKCCFEFSDLEHYCLELLTNANVSDRLREEFAEVFIDEYQDINRVQEAILNAVSGSYNRFMVGDIKQSIYRFRMAEPGLFNDKYEKYGMEQGGHRIDLMDNFRSQQNIIDCVNYAFRRLMTGGDLEVKYYRAAELRAGNTTLPQLPVELIILNKEEIGGISETKEYGNADDESENDDPIADLEKAEKEALIIAERIKAELRNGKTYGDMCILLRSPKNIAAVMNNVLQKAGIPCMTDGEGNFFATPEVETAISLLKIIDNPLQDIELAAVLHSPVVGLSLAELAELRLLAPEESLYAAMKESSDIRIRKFMRQLEDFRNPTKLMGMQDFCRRVFTEFGLLSVMTAQTGGDMRRENLLEFINVAAEYDKAVYKGLYRFISYLEWLREQGKGAPRQIATRNAVTILSIHRSKGLEFPIVFVAAMDKKFNTRDQNDNLLLHREMGLGLRQVDPGRRIKYRTLGFNAITMRMLWETWAEELRVLYVAMTRAKEQLILIGTEKLAVVYQKTAVAGREKNWQLHPMLLKNNSSYLHWLVMALSVHHDCRALRRDECLEISPAISGDDSRWQVEIINDLPAAAMAEEDDKQEQGSRMIAEKMRQVQVTPKLTAAMGWQYEHRDIAALPVKWSATSLKEKKDGDFLPKQRFAKSSDLFMDKKDTVEESARSNKKDGSNYAAIGTCVHYLLEKTDPRKIIAGEDPAVIMAELLAAYDLPEQDKKQININNVAGFFSSLLGEQLLKAHGEGRKIMREVDFILVLTIEEFAQVFFNSDQVSEEQIAEFSACFNLDYRKNTAEKIFFQGVIDLCFETEAGWVLADYKSGYNDLLDDSAVVEKYGSQLKLYQLALEKITGRQVLRKYIYFTMNNRLTEIG